MVNKIWVTLLTVAMLALSYSGTMRAESDEDIEMSAEMPLQGVYKGNSIARINVHIKNSGDPFTGDISLSRMEFDQMYPLSYNREVELSKDEEKVVVLDIHSDNLTGDRQTVVTLKRDGEIIHWASIQQMEQHHEWVVGVLAQDSHAFHFLSLVQADDHRNFFVKSIKPADMPSDPFILDNLDILAIDDLPAGLTEEQVQGIKEWVANGGILLVSGGNSYAKTLDAFGNWLPFSAEVKNGDISQELINLSQMTPPIEKMSEIKDAKELFTNVTRGNGMILITSYDVTDEPMASWQGNKRLWQEVVKKHVMTALIAKEAKSGINHGLMDLSYMSPGIKPPQLPTIAGIWLIYILIVSPGLYVFLKRRDKREWAWVIIPSLSILLTAGVYFLGKYQVVKQDTTHTVSQVEILDEHLAEIDSATSFLMIKGGNYQIEKAKGVRFIPYHSGNGDFEKIRMKENGSIQFTQIPYLSMQQAYAKAVRDDAGFFEAQVYPEDNKLKGYVKNKTVYDLKQVIISVGLQEIPLGDLAKGQQASIDFELKRVYMPVPQNQMKKMRETIGRQERLESMASGHQSITRTLAPVTVSGISEQGMNIFDVAEKKEKTYYSTVVRQALSLSPTPAGKQVFPYGTLPLHLGETKGKWEPIENGYQLTNGFLNFTLQVQPQGVKTEKIEVPLNESPYKPFIKKIYNVKNNQWDIIEREDAIHLGGEKMKDYMTAQGEIILRFENPTTQMYFLPMPYFLVEGEVGQE